MRVRTSSSGPAYPAAGAGGLAPDRPVACADARGRAALSPMVALVGVTAIWGYTFVPVQDAVAIYPLFAFLAVRFGISTLVLAAVRLALAAPPAAERASSAGVGAGALLATAYGLQTAGLDLTTVSSTGFITGSLRRADADHRARPLPHAGRRRGVGRSRARRRRAADAERRARAARRSATRSCSAMPSPSRSRSSRWSGLRRGTTPARSRSSRWPWPASRSP